MDEHQIPIDRLSHADQASIRRSLRAHSLTAAVKAAPGSPSWVCDTPRECRPWILVRGLADRATMGFPYEGRPRGRGQGLDSRAQVFEQKVRTLSKQGHFLLAATQSLKPAAAKA